MTYSSKYLTPALIALGVFAFLPANLQAGETEKGGPDTSKHPDTPVTHEPETAEHPTPAEPEEHPAPTEPEEHPGSGETPKVPTPSTPSNPSSPTGGGGSSTDFGTGNITCVVNGRVFRVRSVSECYVHPQFGNNQARPPVYQPRVKQRRAVIAGGYSYGGGYAGGYVYQPQPIIRYYQPASPAAIMQAEKRARRAASYGYSGGYAVQGGYGYAPQGYGYGGGYAGGYGFAPQGYGYGGDYVVQGGYGRAYGKPNKKHRRMRSNAPVYMPNYTYDPGYVIHYGPTISKDGGY